MNVRGSFSSTTVYGTLTAAHCAHHHGEVFEYGTSENRIGKQFGLLNRASVDATLIKTPKRRAPKTVRTYSRGILPVIGVVGQHDEGLPTGIHGTGTRVCLASRMRERMLCGRVIDKDRHAGSSGSERMRVIDTCKSYNPVTTDCLRYPQADHGDSGGPWFKVRRRGAVAFGLHASRDSSRPWRHRVEFQRVVRNKLASGPSFGDGRILTK